MKPHELKLLRDSLQFGDITTIATELQISTQTVRTALKGMAMTETAKKVIEHARIIQQQRKERQDRLKAAQNVGK